MTEIQLLLVEDDMDDISFLKEALEANGIGFKMDEIMQGDGVVPHLKESERLPDVIILDLNLPRMHGKEVLRSIKSIDKFRYIPVIVLTTSASSEDVRYCMLLGAAKFITKPVSIKEYDNIVEIIIELCAKKIKTR